MVKDAQRQPLDQALDAIKGLWAHMHPTLAPALQQLRDVSQPLWEPLRPQISEAMHGANAYLRGLEPLTLVALAAVATFVVFKLLGALRRWTMVLLLGVVMAYLWPLIAEHIKKQ